MTAVRSTRFINTWRPQGAMERTRKMISEAFNRPVKGSNRSRRGPGRRTR